ncbi:site-specific integrase [Micromonospora sp. NPDC005324]|uniref:tyrosine-type recombinase/integrase n=1 Tax=Micromonospora sp. NPDC005324 TaxID=3157033 RepID=UPI00339EBD5F
MTTMAPARWAAVEATFPIEAEAAPRRPRRSALDSASPAQVVGALPGLPSWPARGKEVSRLRLATSRMLEWLDTLPGDGWQAKWQSAEQQFGSRWRDWSFAGVCATVRSVQHRKQELSRGLGCLIKLRVIKPSYPFLASYSPNQLFIEVRAQVSPELFARMEQSTRDRGVGEEHFRRALNLLTMLVIHLGVGLQDLTIADLLAFQLAAKRRSRDCTYQGSHVAWQMLVDIDVFPPGSTLRSAIYTGQLTSAQLVDKYGFVKGPVRDLLIRYFDERRTRIDYNTLRALAMMLVGQFWADIERHHPDLATIDLPRDVAQAWKDRVRAPRPGRETRNRWDVLMAVRAFYADIAEWALSDPSWAPWVSQSPVRRDEIEGSSKRGRTTAAMHQRIRERLPHLPRLVDSAEQWKSDRAALLATAAHTAVDAIVEHGGVTYRRIAPGEHRAARGQRPNHVVIENLADASWTNVSVAEDEAFWAWAVIETLRLTGVRIEELLELTQLAIVSHRLSDTGELVPLLQIVPSKTDVERLLLVTPELASVLAAIISRIRDSDGTVPLVARYDDYERVAGPQLPHLFQHHDGFQHRNGWRVDVLHHDLVRNLLTGALARSGITDAAGRPVRYTPHDFRRMFATEAVTGGLPIHIAAKVLGHADINTTQAYTAVYQEDLIRSYRTFVDQRRALRPSKEYREPTDSEWTEFQQHFSLRKVELGDCGRPYGTPCAHEHACVRCPMLRVDPRQRQRLIEIIRNLAERVKEAKANNWHGDVEGLTTSLNAAQNKIAHLDRAARNHPGPTVLGFPGSPNEHR